MMLRLSDLTCDCPALVDARVDNGELRQALSRSTLSEREQETALNCALRRRRMRSTKIDVVRQALEKAHWSENFIDFLFYRTAHEHDGPTDGVKKSREVAPKPAPPARKQTVARPAQSKSDAKPEQAVTQPRKSKTDDAPIQPRECIMLKNKLCGFASRHTIFCAGYNKRPEKEGGGRVPCEENAEFHVHYGSTCGNECARHAEHAKTDRKAFVSHIDYIYRTGGAKQ